MHPDLILKAKKQPGETMLICIICSFLGTLQFHFSGAWFDSQLGSASGPRTPRAGASQQPFPRQPRFSSLSVGEFAEALK